MSQNKLITNKRWIYSREHSAIRAQTKYKYTNVWIVHRWVHSWIVETLSLLLSHRSPSPSDLRLLIKQTHTDSHSRIPLATPTPLLCRYAPEAGSRMWARFRSSLNPDLHDYINASSFYFRSVWTRRKHSDIKDNTQPLYVVWRREEAEVATLPSISFTLTRMG